MKGKHNVLYNMSDACVRGGSLLTPSEPPLPPSPYTYAPELVLSMERFMAAVGTLYYATLNLNRI